MKQLIITLFKLLILRVLVEWILVQNYDVTFLHHYFDDFLTLGSLASPVCHNNLQTCVWCKTLGLPLYPDKLEPATRLTILGIQLESEKLQPCLPADKRDRIVTLLDTWSAKQFCKRPELESQGRAFLRRMINLLCVFGHDDHPIRLNQLALWAMRQFWNPTGFPASGQLHKVHYL